MTWLLLAFYGFSPADSCAKLVTLGEIPEEAVLFAELAAREGGDGALLFGRMLELAGRFDEAAGVYDIALAAATDPLTIQWLTDRSNGSGTLDTVLVLSAEVVNYGTVPAHDLLLVMPEPLSHPPYQRIDLLGGAFRPDSGILVCMVDTLRAGEAVDLPVFLHIHQEPYSFRPIPDSRGSFSISSIAGILRETGIPTEYDGSGPCLRMSMEVMEAAGDRGMRLGVTGGLARRGDSLVFHAWNVLEEGIPGLPADPLLFKTDSLRALGHCPTDIIPLWDLLGTDGHELSIFFPEQEASISISLDASLTGFQPALTALPFFGATSAGNTFAFPALDAKGAFR
jgi:hypothetical protein